MHLYDFSHFQICDKYVITPSKCLKKILKPRLGRARPKIIPGGLPVSSINSVHIKILARIRLLGRFTAYLAQTTTASRLLFALG